MNIEEIYSALTPDIYEKFKTAIEIGKWPDGKVLTDEQKTTCMQAVIAYEHKHIPEEERTGYVPPKSTPCDDKNEEKPVKWEK